ncbi:alpha/beta-hydrolase [Macrolepiota fuliginosa MF-IS2]|uniref:Alpha/beta-hydrolase n=1 Tax=Macrolepiota fuliginosa MF-IS2 TaxID=1400762 RepID=A0A9P5XPD1_9AGAR|nr:alpha/beta-hydrolase [Macrolepiota fuliginosa MF-IS2]
MSCPDCTTGDILVGTPKGATKDDGSYLAAAPDGSDSKRAVVLLTDIFGLGLDNPKIIADYLSEQLKCDVWVPDLFKGKPPVRPDQLQMPQRAGEKIGALRWTKFIFTALTSLPSIISTRPSVGEKRIREFINKIKAEHKYDTIGAVGYCYGGIACVRLAVTDIIDTVVVCHPGRFSLKLIDQLVIPVAWVCAEDDFGFPTTKRKKAEEILAERAKDDKRALAYEFQDYKGTTHGFACRPNGQIPEIKEAFEKSLEQIVSWFNKHI